MLFRSNDICDDAALLGVTVSGCTGSALTTPKTALNGGKTTLRLTFSAGIWDLASTNIVPAPAPSSVVDTMSLPANFNFQIDTPSFTCPTALLNDPSNPIYQPGDREILLNTSIFSVTTATGAAPASSLVVVGTKGSATPVTTADFNSQNDLVQTVSLGGSSISVPGFTNSTLDQDVYYRLSFFAQDETGIYAVPAASPACIVNDVATASIGGFLNPDLANKCFIATAAFGAAESPPVVLLREFRDQVLLQFRGGRAFVGWYYRWSPMAAEWLSSHPLARIPVVFLLLPFELVAWLVLHKSISFLVVGMGGFIVLCLVLGLSSGRLLQSRSRLDK
mgnify:CR=1 FL=1